MDTPPCALAPDLAVEAAALAGSPILRLEKPGAPVVYLRARGAPSPGPEYVRVRPLAALGMDPAHPNQFIRRDDPLAHLAEPLP
jgi:hypothetical protein